MAEEYLDRIFFDYRYTSVFRQADSDILKGLTHIKNSVDRLTDVFISENRDELFFLVDARECENLTDICKKIDDKICWFINFGCNNEEAIRKFKYNIVQIILFVQEKIDDTVENSLSISRKITIKSSYEEGKWKTQEAYKLPFYMSKNISTNINQTNADYLVSLLPDKNSCSFLYEHYTDGEKLPAIDEDLKKAIKEWLK